MYGVFYLFSDVIYSYLGLSNGDKVIRYYDIIESFREVNLTWITRWEECRHLQLRCQDSATQTCTIFPISCSPQTILCHHKYPLSFLWSVFQNYSIRHHILAFTFPDFSYSREGPSIAGYRSNSALPIECTQIERTMTQTFRTYIGKLPAKKNTWRRNILRGKQSFCHIRPSYMKNNCGNKGSSTHFTKSTCCEIIKYYLSFLCLVTSFPI